MPRRALFAGAVVAMALAGLSVTAVAIAEPPGRPDLRIGLARAEAAAPVRGRVYVLVRVRNAGRSSAGASKLALSVRVVGGGAARRLAHLTRVRSLRPGHFARLSASGMLPASVPVGARLRVTVCADRGGRVRESNERNNCRTSRTVTVTAPTTAALMRAEVSAGALSRGRALLYTMQAITGDRRLPVRYRTRGDGADDHGVIASIAGQLHTLSARDRALIAPYFLPPDVRARIRPAHRAGRARVPTVTVDCLGFRATQPYGSFSAAGGKVSVWYPKEGSFGFGPRTGEEAAKRFATDIDAIWPTLVKQFREPMPESSAPCAKRGDGKYSVTVQYFYSKRGETVPYGLFAKPFLLSHLQTFCTDTASFIGLRPDADRWTVAHELMHAIQFAYKYKSCGGKQNDWWDEGGANWAADFVFPKDQDEHDYDGAFTHPDQPLWAGGYHAWPFWYFLTKTRTAAVMNSVFAKLATATVRPAVDAAIGGYAKQFPLYLRRLWNRAPVGQPGFSATASFLQWDSVASAPPLIGDTPFPLEGTARTLLLPVLPPGSGTFATPDTANVWTRGDDGGSRNVTGTLAPEAATFRRLTLRDANLREFTFTNALFGRPGEHVEAWMLLANGTWKTEDWSAEKTTLCRDTPAEDVRELYIVSENVGVTGNGIPAGGLRHALAGRNTCGFPKRFDGTFTRVYTSPDRGSWKETIQGSLSYERNTLFPPEADALSSVPYELSGGIITWTVSGSTDGQCPFTFSGSGTEPAKDQTSFGGAGELNLEKVTGHAGAPDPEPMPYYYSIRESQDPTQVAKYDTTDCQGHVEKDGLALPYLNVGEPPPLTPSTQLANVQKSATAKLLTGHRTRFDAANGLAIDDTWSFTGR